MLKQRREVWERNKQFHTLKKLEKYKAEIIESIPKNEELSIYHHGDTWHDLCRGPHLASSRKLEKAFKLTKYQALTGEEIQIMKCYKEFMELVGVQKRIR